MKQELILFCCILRIRENFKIMRIFKQILKRRNHIQFSIFDALIIYYYLILGLQADTCMNYIEYYMKNIHNPHYLLTNSVS